MWTGDTKSFFFNPSMRLSVWDRPSELLNREDVDRLLSNPPHLQVLQSSASGTTPTTPTLSAAVAATSEKEKRKAPAAENETLPKKAKGYFEFDLKYMYRPHFDR